MKHNMKESFFPKAIYDIQPSGQHLVEIQDTLLMVATLSGTSQPCWQVKGEFYQELISHIVPSDHFYSWTCLKPHSIPAYRKEAVLND